MTCVPSRATTSSHFCCCKRAEHPGGTLGHASIEHWLSALCCLQNDPWSLEGSYSLDLLNMLRQGQHPLHVYAPAQVQQQLVNCLGQILQNGHSIFGSFRLYSAGRYAPPSLATYHIIMVHGKSV